jgi:hypothetical protein
METLSHVWSRYSLRARSGAARPSNDSFYERVVFESEAEKLNSGGGADGGVGGGTQRWIVRTVAATPLY